MKNFIEKIKFSIKKEEEKLLNGSYVPDIPENCIAIVRDGAYYIYDICKTSSEKTISLFLSEETEDYNVLNLKNNLFFLINQQQINKGNNNGK